METTPQLSGSFEPPSQRPAQPLVRKKFLATAFLCAAVFFIFFKFWFMPVKILGDSMYPTYLDGTRHFLNRMAYWSNEPQRGDVIGLAAPGGDIYIKRIIGLPGELLEKDERGKTLIDGKLYSDPKIQGPIPWEQAKNWQRLGKDEYFVIGDNRRISMFGAIPRDTIIGKIVF